MSSKQGPAMSWQEWGRQDGVGLAQLIKHGQLSAQQVTRQASQAIARVNPHIQAVLEVFDDVVENPGAENSSPEGPLYGVPILLKDLAAQLQGRLQESGSALHRGHVAAVTDPFISNLLSAGLIPVGRSTTAELGLAWDTTNTYRGATVSTRNPWNLARTSGGSSGGSAAAVAAGAVPMASSSDGGGSTRIPAAHCGLVGLKPSRGLCPRPWGASEYSSRISTDGVLTRSVRDCAAVLDYSAHVPAGASFIHSPRDTRGYAAALGEGAPTLRIGWSLGAWGRASALAPGIAERVRAVLQTLAEAGHELVEVHDHDIVNWPELWESYTINWMSARGQLALSAAKKGLSLEELKSRLTPMVHNMFLASAAYDKADLWRMMEMNSRLSRAYGTLFERIDLLVTPTYAAAVPLANGESSTLRDGDVQAWFDRQLDAGRYAILGNEVGAPAISLPAGLNSDGLPVGVQLCGRWQDERTLLQIAAQLEQARPEWFGQVPPLHVSTAPEFTTP